MYKFLRTLTVVAVAALGLAACSDDNATNPLDTALVRVVHASPDAPNVDVLVDGDLALTNVPFRAASGFLTVPAGPQRIQIRPTGTSTDVIDVTLDFGVNRVYTVLATGEVADLQPLLVEDDPTAPADGQARIRVIHAAPAAGGVDVYATAPGADLDAATPVLSDVPFRAVSEYLAVPAGTYQLRVTTAGTTTVAIDATITLAENGPIRTVVAVDAVGGGAPLAPIVLRDRN